MVSAGGGITCNFKVVRGNLSAYPNKEGKRVVEETTRAGRTGKGKCKKEKLAMMKRPFQMPSKKGLIQRA